MSTIPVPSYNPSSRRRSRRSTPSFDLLQQALLALASGLLLFFVFSSLLVLGIQVWFAGRIFPGVTVAGVPVGGLSSEAAATLIAQNFTYPVQGKILLHDQSSNWLATPGDLGLYLNPQASASTAFSYGRNEAPLRALSDQFAAWYHGVNLPPVLVLDQRTTHAYLTGLAGKINRPKVEASLSLKNTEVIAVPGQIGRTLDTAANIELVRTHLYTLQDSSIALIVVDSPPQILDAGEAAKVARSILSQPLTLTLPSNETEKGGPWVIEPANLAGMLTIERAQNNTASQYQVSLNPASLKTYLEKLAPSFKRDPQNARFTFNDESHQLEVLQGSVTGRALDVNATLKAVQEKLPQGQHSLPLVFAYTEPQVNDKASGESLGIRELVQAQTSYFYGSSASRVQNIRTAASRFHGLLVAPGEVFSMAKALGDINLDNGYAEASIILGGSTIKGVGGGVCQVSTTLFRTAFFGGFPVKERYAHAYRVYYYEKAAGNRLDERLAGLDATVFVPLVDFKFTNDTPHWLLMETYVVPGNSSITWKFYSTSDGRKVDWDTSGPVNMVPAPEAKYIENPDLKKGEIKQVDWAADGADVTVNRTVTRNGSVYFKDKFQTHYEPWRDVFEYGPGTELPEKQP